MSIYAAGSPGQSNSSMREGDTTPISIVCSGSRLPESRSLTTSHSAEFLAWNSFVAVAGFVPLSSGQGTSLAMDLPMPSLRPRSSSPPSSPV